MVFEIITAINIPIAGNGQYQYYVTPADRYWRPLIISGDYTGTFNLDAFLLWYGDNANAVYLDDDQNRGTPFDIKLGHLNMWFKPKWALHFVVSALTVAGAVVIRMLHEVAVKGKEIPAVQDVNIRGQPIRTNPWGWPFG